mmetsp:Transcript_109966/g.350182  ORF Transcript_109966/g.350182 Transcript_109966/m.350182 type:complete len:369 (+) Transcript_109966:106-1212(+)
MAFLGALMRKASSRSGSKENADSSAETGCRLGGAVPGQVVNTLCGKPAAQKPPGCIGVLQPRLCGGPLRDISNVASQQVGGYVTADLKALAKKPPALIGPSAVRPCKEAENAEDAAEYVPDMLSQLFSKELEYMARPEYMTTQIELNARMRSVLIDWLVEVHADYRMKPDTLFLAVSLIDRYLSRKSVQRSRLQLIGVVALLAASKFEELHPPKVSNLVYIADNAYTKAEILRTECTFLAALGFEVMSPTCVHFFDYFQRLNGCDAFQLALTQYILELSLLDTRMLRHEPSRVAAAALLLSNELTGRTHTWPREMAVEARHSGPALGGVVDELRALLEAAPRSSLQAARKKYSKDEHLAVAKAFPRTQ